ncbi:hypothetical protein CDAR_379041 [Caerostris darwini]|uniref:Secreted protein n=1 Tax=Caerostris darwini TaxID=1538125 RepID=A0AAV4TZS9_9ARAC|nr:hypothetical protein CDAR_379041 [Caerostris darwini]
MAATFAGPWILWALLVPVWSVVNPHYFVSHPDHRVAPGGIRACIPRPSKPKSLFLPSKVENRGTHVNSCRISTAVNRRSRIFHARIKRGLCYNNKSGPLNLCSTMRRRRREKSIDTSRQRREMLALSTMDIGLGDPDHSCVLSETSPLLSETITTPSR